LKGEIQKSPAERLEVSRRKRTTKKDRKNALTWKKRKKGEKQDLKPTKKGTSGRERLRNQEIGGSGESF